MASALATNLILAFRVVLHHLAPRRCADFTLRRWCWRLRWSNPFGNEWTLGIGKTAMFEGYKVPDATCADDRIPVYRPDLSGNEKAYVNDCLDTTWISSLGSYIDRFERAVADYAGVRHAIAVSNGTVALHLAFHALGIGPGDEVIVPSFTYIASVNTIAQTGATPIFADSCADDWMLDADHVAKLITPQTKAIVPVHLYGNPCQLDPLTALAERHGLHLVEDCAEALGTSVAGRHVGAVGSVGTFSFFGNKTVTTGEGGMVVTNDDELAALMRQLKGQGQSRTRRYWHEMLGFNYRMTNICAAIGTAQMERIDEILRNKRHLADRYRAAFSDLDVSFQHRAPETVSSEWLVSLLLPAGANRDHIMADMTDEGVETRPVFFPAHHMPMYLQQRHDLRVAEDIAARGLSLPSFPSMTEREQDRVIAALRAALD